MRPFVTARNDLRRSYFEPAGYCRSSVVPDRELVMQRKNPRRPWKPEEESQLREMAKAGKSVTMIALRLKRTVTAVGGRSSILGVSLRELKQTENPH